MEQKITKSGWEYLEINPRLSDKDIVIFHGYGAEASNLVFLHKLYPKARWLFPQAPKDKHGIPTWFDIDPDTFQRALETKEPLINDSFFQRKKQILEFIQESKVNLKNLIIGGFSQGAIVSASLSLMEFTPQGLLLLSGGSTLEILPKKLEKQASFFQSHGRQDEILPFEAAQNLYYKLKKHGWSGEFHPFDGGHEIPIDITKKIKAYLESIDLKNPN